MASVARLPPLVGPALWASVLCSVSAGGRLRLTPVLPCAHMTLKESPVPWEPRLPLCEVEMLRPALWVTVTTWDR